MGPAVVRNRVKRMIRESFRHVQADLGLIGGESVDLVVSVHPHEALGLREYQALLADLAGALSARLERRAVEGR